MPEPEKETKGPFLYWPLFPWIQEPQPWKLRKKRPAEPEPPAPAPPPPPPPAAAANPAEQERPPAQP